jgi:branched-chain amino acid transport system ATP-binding protein
MLKVEGLRSGYGAVEVLHNVSITVPDKKIVTVVGANGAGKSTLINSISRLIDVNTGTMSFREKDITRMSAPDVVELGIIQVPEGRQLFGPLTVEENLQLGYYRLRRHRHRESFDQRLKFVQELFPRLRERAGQKAATLSGGEQQMVAMGRALMADPELLLLDEPSLGLAPLIIERIFEVLQALQTQGLTMVLVEQRAEAALTLANYAYVLSVGEVVAEGEAQVLRDDARIKQAYLGEGLAFS